MGQRSARTSSQQASEAIYTPADIYKLPPGVYRSGGLTHIATERQKLLNRIRRLRGQIDALERAVEAEEGCIEAMRLLTAARGAINAIMAEVVEDHIEGHMIDPERRRSRAEEAATDELVEVLRTYIK